MKKWEYWMDNLCFDSFAERYYWNNNSGWFKTEVEALNYLGQFGYELATKEWDEYEEGYECTFKRELAE